MGKTVMVVTFCNRDLEPNYGQTLQAYAMQRVLKAYGYHIKVVSYMNRGWKARLQYKKQYLLRRSKTSQERRFCLFTKFVQTKMGHVYQCFSPWEVKLLSMKTDILLCGSDVIWRLEYFDPIYFLNFSSKKKKRIAYAPSLGYEYTSKKYADPIYKKMEEQLKNIDNLSTREEKGCKILKTNCHCGTAACVLDPVFLLGKGHWSGIAADCPSNKGKPYVLVYLLENNSKRQLLSRKLAEGLCRTSGDTDLIYMNGLSAEKRNRIDAGPEEFLSLIRNAEAVITDSFHGAAFSIIFEKEFYILKKSSGRFAADLRLDHIMTLFSLEDRVITEGEELDISLIPIEYERIKEVLKREKKKSLSFLKQALSII